MKKRKLKLFSKMKNIKWDFLKKQIMNKLIIVYG